MNFKFWCYQHAWQTVDLNGESPGKRFVKSSFFKETPWGSEGDGIFEIPPSAVPSDSVVTVSEHRDDWYEPQRIRYVIKNGEWVAI